jgi:hypothetical protein
MLALGSTPGSAAGVKVNEAVVDPGECHDDARGLSAKGVVTSSRMLLARRREARPCSGSKPSNACLPRPLLSSLTQMAELWQEASIRTGLLSWLVASQGIGTPAARMAADRDQTSTTSSCQG